MPTPCRFARRVIAALVIAVCAAALTRASDTPAVGTTRDKSDVSLPDIDSLLRGKKWDEARSRLATFIRAHPDRAEAYFALSQVEIAANRPTNAAEALEHATRLEPTNAFYFQRLGDSYEASSKEASMFSKLGLAKKSIAAYDRAVALDPNNIAYRKARYEFYRGAPSLVGGGTDKARTEAAEVEKLDAVEGAFLRADLCVKENKAQEAGAILEELEARFPENKRIKIQMGRFAATTGHKLQEGESALRAFLAAPVEANDPPLSSAHRWLAEIYERKSDLTAARAEYKEMLRLNPESARARAALKRLEQQR